MSLTNKDLPYFFDPQENNFIVTTYRMKNAIFWDIPPHGSCKNRRFGECSTFIIRATKIGEQETTLAVTSNLRTQRKNTVYTIVIPCSVRLLLLTADIIRSSETSVLTHGVTSQKTAFIIAIAVKASYLT
jgi:hypothetical protein